MENAIKNDPLVSIVLLSFNRRDDLDHSLQHVFKQTYKNYEVVVVDNNSDDGSAEMLIKNYPQVTLISLPENRGIAGWNEGAKAAKGEYLFFLDDDSYPNGDTLTKASAAFLATTILALDIRQPSQPDLGHNTVFENSIPTFIGCGVIIPRKIFAELGGFEPLLFLYAHEEEFAMRALNSGYTLQFLPDAVVYHRRRQKSRLLNTHMDTRRIYFKNRNSIILLLLHFPLSKAIPRICRMGAGRILFSIVHHCFLPVVKSLYDGIAVSISHWNKRLILDEDVQHKFGYGKGLGSFFAGGDTGFKRPRWL